MIKFKFFIYKYKYPPSKEHCNGDQTAQRNWSINSLILKHWSLLIEW